MGILRVSGLAPVSGPTSIRAPDPRRVKASELDRDGGSLYIAKRLRCIQVEPNEHIAPPKARKGDKR